MVPKSVCVVSVDGGPRDEVCGGVEGGEWRGREMVMFRDREGQDRGSRDGM